MHPMMGVVGQCCRFCGFVVAFALVLKEEATGGTKPREGAIC